MKTKHRILVVDDYPDAAEMACTLLEILGHETCAASSANEALIAADTFVPDVALVDIGLPDLDGYEVAKELRARSRQALYLVAITGWNTESPERAYAAGFDQFILKPVDEKKLRHVLWLAEIRLATRTPDSDRVYRL